jgi:hypothetical protein
MQLDVVGPRVLDIRELHGKNNMLRRLRTIGRV